MMVEPSREVSTTSVGLSLPLEMDTLPAEWYKEWKTTERQNSSQHYKMLVGLAVEIDKAMASLANPFPMHL